MATQETEFKEWFLSNYPNLDGSKIKRQGPGEKSTHLKFKNGCGISSVEELTIMFDNLGLAYTPSKEYSGSPLYQLQGFTIHWKTLSIGVLLTIAEPGSFERKRHTPQSLGLAGQSFDTPLELREQFYRGLCLIEDDISIRSCLLSMLDNIESSGAIPIINHVLLSKKENIHRMTSDLGEVLSAYGSSVKGNIIRFPSNSNEHNIDYYENDQPVNSKGRGAGNKINLGKYKDIIVQDSDVSRFLYSYATHDKNSFFKYSSALSMEVALLSAKVGGTDESDVESFVKTTTYNEFYKWIVDTECFRGLGVPRSQDARTLWDQGDTNPFYFTLNTFVHELWGKKNTAIISQVVNKFLPKTKFVHVDIVGSNVVLDETISTEITEWMTEYHSRSTKAWHNWPAIQSRIIK